LLVEWPSISPVAALELLDARFPDRYETDDWDSYDLVLGFCF
jgi:hypothetical protein